MARWRDSFNSARRRRHAAESGTEAGFSIVEILVAMMLLLVGILGAFAMIDTANGTTLANQARTGGVNLAREVAEGAQAVEESVPYSQLSEGCPAPSSPSNPCTPTSPIVAGLQAQPGLAPDASSPAGAWTIERDDVDYTIRVASCSMDDPSDGSGSHGSGGPFCSDVGSAGTSDSNPDDFKRVIVDVAWSHTRGSQSTRSVALLQSAGVNAPAVSCLRLPSSTCPVTTAPKVTSASVTSMDFTAELSGAANRVVWYVDGAFQGTVNPNATSGGVTARFSWALETVGGSSEVFDGTYTVSATAFDADGRSGTTASTQVQINRRVPVAPGGFLAGRNTVLGGNAPIGGVDLVWLPVPDQDILYYRIFRRVGTGTPQMAGQTNDAAVTNFTDPMPPPAGTVWTAPCSDPRQAGATQLTYYVVAVDQNGTATRQGTPTATIDVDACNTAPEDPPGGALASTQNPDGSLTLTGALPASPSDPDAGDRVDAVRIYRWAGAGGPSSPADRLEYLPASGSSFSFTDTAPRPNGDPLRYCFTNVDRRMQESICSNVVSG